MLSISLWTLVLFKLLSSENVAQNRPRNTTTYQIIITNRRKYLRQTQTKNVQRMPAELWRMDLIKKNCKEVVLNVQFQITAQTQARSANQNQVQTKQYPKSLTFPNKSEIMSHLFLYVIKNKIHKPRSKYTLFVIVVICPCSIMCCPDYNNVSSLQATAVLH